MKTERTVLLVEDDPDDQRLFIEAMAEAEPTLRCIIAGDGQEALDILSDPTVPPPCLIVMDLRMPKLGGEKCLTAIRNQRRFDNIPIVIYTTSRSVTESQELMAQGAVHFVSKPMSEDDVYYQVSLMVEEYCSTLKEQESSTGESENLN